jgi:hypothetical protein
VSASHVLRNLRSISYQNINIKKPMTSCPGRTFLALSIAAMPAASAAVISNFTFTGPPWTTDKENNFATFAANSPSEDTDLFSATSILSNSGHTGGGYDSFYIRDADIGTSIFSGTATPGVGMNLGNSNATVPTNYVSFTVTPDSGYQTTFESISMYTGVNGASDDYNVQIRAWDGVAETTLGTISRTTPASPASNSTVVQDSIDFADFTSSGVTEFRLYSYGVSQPGAAPQNGGVRFDDIVLNGFTTAIPEPSVASLIGLVGLGLLVRRSR